MTNAIQVRNLTKAYRTYRRPADRLVEAISGRRRYRETLALDDVSFDVARGETVGLIGRNGAGKSTLLKLLTGVTSPTSGSIETSGKVSAILELGSGFHPEFTGRANAELNASILGMSTEEINERLPLIYEFSELGDFLDRPVRTYSSGMIMRLAFSVAVHADPEILLIDEAIAVGDGHFQKKCLAAMRSFQERGRTVIFCSHSLAAISDICRSAIWLDRGKLIRSGRSSEVITHYEKDLFHKDPEDRTESVALIERRSQVRLTSSTTVGDDGNPRSVFSRDEQLIVRVGLESVDPNLRIFVAVGVERVMDQVQCFTCAMHWDGVAPLEGQHQYEVELRIPRLSVAPNDYRLFIFLMDESALHVFDRTEFTFSVAGTTDPNSIFVPDYAWNY